MLLNMLLKPSKQKSTARIYMPQINQLFASAQWKEINNPSFKLVDVKQLKKFLKHNVVNRGDYSDEHQCEHFAYELLGDVTKWDSDLAFGYARIKKHDCLDFHALNVFIATDGKLYFVEPQTDEVFLVLDCWDVRFVMM